MSVEAGRTHRNELHFSHESKKILQQKRFAFYKLQGTTLTGILQKYSSLGIKFTDMDWLRQDSPLLFEQSTTGIVAVSWKPLDVVGDKYDHNIQLNDVREELYEDVDVRQGSLADILDITLQHKLRYKKLPRTLHDTPGAFIVSSTASGEHALAVGGWESPDGISIRIFPDDSDTAEYGIVPFVYPLQ